MPMNKNMEEKKMPMNKRGCENHCLKFTATPCKNIVHIFIFFVDLHSYF